MPADAKPRWITVTQPFEFRVSPVSVIEFKQRDMGEHLVIAALADHAVSIGAATEGKAPGSKTRSRKGGKKARTARPAKPKLATEAELAANEVVGNVEEAASSNDQANSAVAGENLADDDSASLGSVASGDQAS